MREFTIHNATSYSNLPEIKSRLELEPMTLREIIVRYNPSKGLPPEEEIDQWPVKMIFLDSQGKFVIFRIWSLNVGYRGTGPSDFEELLKFFNIKYDPDDIYTKQRADDTGYIYLQYNVE